MRVHGSSQGRKKKEREREGEKRDLGEKECRYIEFLKHQCAELGGRPAAGVSGPVAARIKGGWRTLARNSAVLKPGSAIIIGCSAGARQGVARHRWVWFEGRCAPNPNCMSVRGIIT